MKAITLSLNNRQQLDRVRFFAGLFGKVPPITRLCDHLTALLCFRFSYASLDAEPCLFTRSYSSLNSRHDLQVGS